MLIQVAAARLMMTTWTPYLYFTQTLGAFGAVLGLALGQSRFRTRTVFWLAAAYTAVVLPWQLTGMVEAEALFGERLASIGGRTWFSLGQFFARQPVEDAILFIALAAFGLWLMGLSAGYFLAREQDYLTAVLPAGIIMLLTQAYDNFLPVRVWALGIYVFLALLLLGRMYFNQNRFQWDRDRVFVTFESRRDLMNTLVTVAAIAVLAAWSLPTSLTSIQSARETWNRVTRPLRERFSNAVAALESPYGGGSARGDFYGETLSLGRNASLGDQPVLTVRPDDEGKDVPPRYYWRGHIYDYYSKGRWSTTATSTIEFSPRTDELSLPAAELEREEVRFTMIMQLSRQELLYAPAEPVWINRPGVLLTMPAAGQGQDLAAWEANPGLLGGDRYEVRARIVNPTVEDLRAAGSDYPAWITDRYLQVPESILPDVKALAGEIAGDMETPYDMAQAITTYLRREIRYSTELPPLPKDRDPVLWVLFDSKQGFCMYYASAEVMLLRSLGIPARMAVGFAQGQAGENSTYIVRKVDAHAWPEVYFPGIGWVEFEPTGNQEPLQRPLTSRRSDASNDPPAIPPGLQLDEDGRDALREGRVDESGTLTPLPFQETPLGRAVLIASSLLAATGLLLLNRRYQIIQRLPDYLSASYRRSGNAPPAWLTRWARWNTSSSIERSFHAINFSLRWLGKPQPRHATPIARAQALRRLLPTAAGPIDLLLAEHQSTLFSPRPGNNARARKAAFDILLKTFGFSIRKILDFITGAPPEPGRYL